MNFIRECWYCAGWSQDFTDEPEARCLLEEDIVFFRTSDGVLHALEDTCPHRQAPLSQGKRIDDSLRCPYHGMRFDGNGICVHIPGQAQIPKNAYVRSYPVEERYGVVWVWMGDRDCADPASIFYIPAFDAYGWKTHLGGAQEIKANYTIVAENLCDPAHVSFVHPTSLGNADSEEIPVQTRREQGPAGEIIVTWRWIRNSQPVGFFQKFGGFTGNVDRWHYYYMHTPNIAAIDFGSAATEHALSEEEREQGVQIWALHFLTPVNATLTIDHWLHIRNIATDKIEVGAAMNDMFQTVFNEDKAILEPLQRRETSWTNRHSKRKHSLNLALDRGAILYRKAITKRLVAETRPVANMADAQSGLVEKNECPQ